ncbi:hypothetical protein H229_0664 [Klebsiella pneumoniae UHKPC02]|nr:hypothetical protein HMPREF9538_00470 [Klebsiella sp. MS 92-3]EPO81381.1 hypothetical protein H229_0664 [Klebsiella pneumoniae UHKPC02]
MLVYLPDHRNVNASDPPLTGYKFRRGALLKISAMNGVGKICNKGNELH